MNSRPALRQPTGLLTGYGARRLRRNRDTMAPHRARMAGWISSVFRNGRHRAPRLRHGPVASACAEAADAPILIVPYMWIGDFVRCHSVVQLLQARFPGRAVDILTTKLCAPLLDYMPGVRQGIVWDLP